MSELGEVIEKLNHVLMNESWYVSDNESGGNGLNVVETYDLKPILDALRKLDRPVQYVVKYGYENRFVDMVFYRLNGVCICAAKINHEEAKIYCLRMINDPIALIGLPPITMEQITFVKV